MKIPLSQASRRFVATLMGLGMSCVHAQTAPPPDGAIHLHMGLGNFQPDRNSPLSSQQGEYGFFVGAGRRFSPHGAWDIDFSAYNQSFDTPSTIAAPLLGTKDPRSTLSTTGLSGSLRLIESWERLETYAGAGLGFYTVRFKATGQQLGLPAQLTRDQYSLGWHALAGLSLRVSDQISLGLEYRLLRVQASFEDIVPGKLEAGGSSLMLLLRFQL